MTLQQLKCFIIVCRTRSFSKAADVLYISQPAVSKNVYELEKEWNVQLLDRSTTPLTITPAGEFALNNARPLLQQAERFSNTMHRMGNHETSLTLVMNSQVSFLFYPNVIAAFKRANPDIHTHLMEVQEHADQHLKNEPSADVLIMPQVRNRFEGDDFIVEKLFDTEYVILAGQQSALANVKALTPDIVADLPVITDYYPKDIYADHFVPHRLASFLHGNSIKVLSNQISLNTNVIASNNAYGLMFRESAARISNTVAIPLVPSWTQTMYACYAKYKQNYPVIQKFISFLKEYDYTNI